MILICGVNEDRAAPLKAKNGAQSRTGIRIFFFLMRRAQGLFIRLDVARVVPTGVMPV